MPIDDSEGVRIVTYTDDEPPRKRACINCGRRSLCGAGSRCGYDRHYIGYCDTWDDWCKHWTKDKRKPGEIDVFDEDGRK